jgi:hypothetical protein
MRKTMLIVYVLLAISTFAVAQTNTSTSGNSSNSQNSTSSSSFSCPCHVTQISAENSLNQLHQECKEKKGEDSFSMKKLSENCFCIEGACDIHYSSASVDTVDYSSSSSSIVNSSSSEYLYAGGVCYIDSVYYEGVKNVPTVHRDLYSVLPYMKNVDGIKVSNCSCNQDGSFKCKYSNFGVPIGYEPIDVPLCGLSNAYWCPGIADGMCDYSGSSIDIYHSDQYWNTNYIWGVKNFSNNGVLEINDDMQPLYVVSTDNERFLFFWMSRPLAENVNTYDLEEAFLKANPRFPSANKMNEYCRGEWFPHDDECFGYASEVEIALQDSIDNCALSMGIAKYDTTLSERGWCVVGTCEPGNDPYYSSSSSYFEESSSSQEISSSSESESSSSEDSSSSETGLCKSVPVNEIPYNTKSACFENNGRCYKCKAGISESDCRSSWTWQNPYTPVDTYYWFNEVNCSTGEKIDKGIGVCPAQPLDDIPDNLSKACFALGGKCYKCKDTSPNGGCAESWIWKEKLYYVEPYYLEEVDCYDPFEEDDDEGEFVENNQYACLVEKNHSLFKKTADRDAYFVEEKNAIKHGVNTLVSNYSYDALGRNLNKNTSLYNRTHSYKRSLSQDSQNDDVFVLKKDGTTSGHVEGLIRISSIRETFLAHKKGKLKGTPLVKNDNVTYEIYVQISVTFGEINYGNMDPQLIAHEKEHERIYKSIDKKELKVTVLTHKDLNIDEICQRKKDEIWNAAMPIIKSMLEQQNRWDDLDVNNISEHRINIDGKLIELEYEFKNGYKCEC